MEATSSSSASSSSVSQENPTYNEISMEQSLFISDSLKNLKTLRGQLYSAAEYFEVSYTNDDHKQMVANTLKDYAVQAIVNAVDHLGSASDKVNILLGEKVDEVTVTELKVSCIEQRLQTCQDHNGQEGLSQQSLVIATPKYHKRYILPVEGTVRSTTQDGGKQRSLWLDRKDEEPRRKLQMELQKTTGDTPSSFRRMSSSLPCAQPATILVTDKRTISPAPAARLFRSRSMSSRPTTTNSSNTQRSTTPNPSLTRRSTLNSCNTQRLYPSEPQKSASMRLYSEKDDQRGTDNHSSRSKRLLKALLSRNKSKNDPMMYSYLEEY